VARRRGEKRSQIRRAGKEREGVRLGGETAAAFEIDAERKCVCRQVLSAVANDLARLTNE
jgi:hypothetical protein